MRKGLLYILFSFACVSVSLAQTEKYPLQVGDTDTISELNWSPDNRLILSSSGDDNALRLWDMATGKVLWKSDVSFLQDDTETYSIRISDWTRDQKFIVTGTSNGKLQLWEAATGKLLWNIRAHAGTVTAISVSPDAKAITSSADLGDWKSELKVWALSDGKLIRDLSANQRDISAIRFIDGDRFQTGNGFGEITTWSTHDFKVVAMRQILPCGVAYKERSSAVYSSDFTLIAAQCQKQLVITNVVTGKIFKRIPKEEHYSLPTFSRDGKSLLLPDTADSKMFDLSTNWIKEFDDFDNGALNNDGSLIATLPNYRADGIRIIDTRTGRQQGWLVGHPGIIRSLAFSPNGKRFASGSADKVVRIWDTESRRILFSLEGHTRTVESVIFSADGKTLTSQSEKETILWSTENGAKLKEIEEDQRFEDNRSRSLSPSGRLALVEEYEKPFRLVNARTDETIKEFVYIDQLDNLVFTPDEEHFLAKPWWSGWQLWSIKDGRPVREFEVVYSVYNRVAFHPDGRTFITGGEGQNIFMFDMETGMMLWSLFPVDRKEFEGKKAWEARRVAFINREKENARLADIENEPYKNQVYITFDHYGDMTPLGEQRLAESGEPNKSKVKKSAEESNAIWLRLHNDSPLPVSVPTQSMYLANGKCFFEFPNKQKVLGLCDDKEISVWLGLEDKDGKPLRYGFDFGSSIILLPKKSVLFAVQREILENGNAINFAFTFQKPVDENKIGNYGNPVTLRFRESDLPKE